jgi:hypothetical protein
MIHRSRLFALCAALTLLLTGCDRQQVMRWFAPQDEAAIGQHYLDEIRAGNYGAVEKDLDAVLQTAQATAVFDGVSTFLYKDETPKSVKLVTNDAIPKDGATIYNLGYEYEFNEGWRLVELVLTKTGSVTKISGLHTYALSDSLEDAYAFNFHNKAPRHYWFLAAMALVALFTFATAMACWRMPMRGKWFWLIFILLGFGEITLNWTNGAIYYDFVAVELFGVGFARDLMGAVTLQLGAPIGAICFWIGWAICRGRKANA